MYAAMLKQAKCECADPGCTCAGKCDRVATERLYRIDMQDASGTCFCEACGDDAFSSGLFASDEEAE